MIAVYEARGSVFIAAIIVLLKVGLNSLLSSLENDLRGAFAAKHKLVTQGLLHHFNILRQF
jgi:hypothetical protein